MDCERFKSGDKGQKYEITYLDPKDGVRYVFGWADDLLVAEALCSCIMDHPVWKDPYIVNRCPIKP